MIRIASFAAAVLLAAPAFAQTTLVDPPAETTSPPVVEVPSFQLQQPVLNALVQADDLSVAAGFADFGLRLGEGALVAGCGGVAAAGVIIGFVGDGGASNVAVATTLIIGGVALGGVLMLAMPAIDALILQHIGDARHFRRALGPLMITSYVSHLLVDALTVALLGVGQGAASLVAYLVGSAAGSTAMGYVHHASEVAIAEPMGWSTVPAPQGPSIPTSFAPGYTWRF